MGWTRVEPSNADWCVFTIGGKSETQPFGSVTETDYWYEYVAGDAPTEDEASQFVPDGWAVLEFTVTATPHGKYALTHCARCKKVITQTKDTWFSDDDDFMCPDGEEQHKP